ncbi:unnamed protein product [Orchesella dallaii]|uniref:C2H2-type domain-containing protein n=1 Tax=Orchesella dallaii TaxID=48710 RepID=A0ABP1QDS6_9HEXA
MELNFYCCSFCYQNVDEDENVLEKEEANEVLSKFRKLVSRCFAMGRKREEEFSQVKLESCPDCLTIVTSFCDLYHQLKCLELEVEWRLSRLKKVMSLADGVEFRKENFRKRWRKRGGDQREGEREAVEEFRKELIKKCNLLSRISFPKVTLTRKRRKINQAELDRILANPQSIIPFLGKGVVSGEGLMVDLVLVPNQHAWRQASPEKLGVDDGEKIPVITNVQGAATAPPQLPPVPIVTAAVAAATPVPLAQEAVVPMEIEQVSSEPSSSSLSGSVSLRPKRKAATSKPPILEDDTQSEETQKADDIENHNDNPDDSDFDFDNEAEVELISVADSDDDDYHIDEDEAGAKSELEQKKKVSSSVRSPSRKKRKTASASYTVTELNYTCDNCCRRFETEEKLKAHQKLHGEFKCFETTCSFKADYAPKLAEHELKHSQKNIKVDGDGEEDEQEGEDDDDHNESELKSGTSSTSVTVKTKKTLKTGKGSHIVYCPRCPNLKLTRKTSYILHFLEAHLNLQSLNDINQCIICKLTFLETPTGRRSLKKHMRTQHNIEGLEPSSIIHCDKCPAYFLKHSHLFAHNKRAHGGDMLQCKVCGSKLANSFSLRMHRIEVHKLNPLDFQFLCDILGCEERLETERDLESHKRARHNKSFKKQVDIMICTECGKKCAGPLGLQGHMRTHQEGFEEGLRKNNKKEASIVCDECGKSFINNSRLECHKEVVHLGPEHWKFECEVCGKKCFNNNKLEEHKRVHVKEKPFVCDVCGASYAHAHNLRQHKKIKHSLRKEEIKQDVC